MKLSQDNNDATQPQKKFHLMTLHYVLFIVFIWEISARTKIVPNYILPPASKVITTLFLELVYGRLLLMTLRSLSILFEGLLLNLIISVVIIVLYQRSNEFRSIYSIISTIMNSIPNLALLPIIIMWFGIGTSAILALVSHSVLWMLTISINERIQTIPPIYKDIANNFELNTCQRLVGIYIPAILPDIISALKIAWGRGWRSLIGAEIVFGAIGSRGGIGYYINLNRLNGNMAKVLAGVILIALVGLAVDYGFFRTVLKRVRKWGITSE